MSCPLASSSIPTRMKTPVLSFTFSGNISMDNHQWRMSQAYTYAFHLSIHIQITLITYHLYILFVHVNLFLCMVYVFGISFIYTFTVFLFLYFTYSYTSHLSVLLLIAFHVQLLISFLRPCPYHVVFHVVVTRPCYTFHVLT